VDDKKSRTYSNRPSTFVFFVKQWQQRTTPDLATKGSYFEFLWGVTASNIYRRLAKPTILSDQFVDLE
jgi:hypothetical protein